MRREWAQLTRLTGDRPLTIERVVRAGLRPGILSPWWDVDGPDDYDALASRLAWMSALAKDVPRRTWEFVKSTG